MIKNVNKIAETGVKEIVLTGVNIGDFGYGQNIDGDEKKRKEYYSREKEMNAKKARIDVLTPEKKQAILDKAALDGSEKEYEERRKHLMAYQDMIMNARKKRREAKQISNLEVEI